MELDSIVEAVEKSNIDKEIENLPQGDERAYRELLRGNMEDTYWCEVNHVDLSSEEGFTRAKEITYKEYTSPIERKY